MTTLSVNALWLRVFAPFAAGYFLSYLLRSVNAVIAPDLTRDLGLSATDLGLLTSAYFLAFGAFQIPLGLLLDRYGPSRVEAALLALAAAGCALFAASAGMVQAGIARALIGVGVSACLMASFKGFHQWFASERQPALVGAVMAAGGLGALAASVPLEWALPLAGWRGLFAALAVLCLLVAVAVWSVPRHDSGIATERLADALAGVGRVFASPVFWRYAPLNALVVGGFMALQGLWAVPWLMATQGATRAVAAQHLLWVSIAMLAGFVAIALFATALARRGVKPLHLFAGGLALALAAGAAILAGVGDSRLMWALLGLTFSAGNLAYPIVIAQFPAQLSGRVSTAYNLMAFVGAFAIQWGFGVVVDAARAAGHGQAPALHIAFGLLLALQVLAVAWFAAGFIRRAPQGSAAS